MFVNQSRLRFLLQPHHYFDPVHYKLEVQNLFSPAWHLICARSELSRPGDFVTQDLFGTPILLRNFDGKIKAFVNVCPHRHSMLTSVPCGNSEMLRCQYHGWEFDEEGKTGRIPEAKAFRPWDRENSHLVPVELQSCGDLLFVSISPQSPSLEDWLSPYFDEIQREFALPQWRLRHVWHYDCEANWKVAAENTLESYHVNALHPKWFGQTLPSEENSQHVLEDRYTSLDFKAATPGEMRQAKLKEFLGGTATLQYRHRHIHPHTVFCMTDTLNYAVNYFPTSATTVQIRLRLFAYRGTRRGFPFTIASEIAWRIAKRIAIAVLTEDRDIYADQQRGLTVSTHPGVIGAREERINQFQQYVLTQCGLPIE